MSDTDANDYHKLKKALLTRYKYTDNGYKKRFREAKPETEETPDQFVTRLKNYLAKWLELSGEFEALVDLIVKEQLINACSEELAVHLLGRGPKDLVEFTTWAQQYLITHKQQLGEGPSLQIQHKNARGRYGATDAKVMATESECPTKVSPGKDQKSSTPVGQSNQKKTLVMVARSNEDGEGAFT